MNTPHYKISILSPGLILMDLIATILIVMGAMGLFVDIKIISEAGDNLYWLAFIGGLFLLVLCQIKIVVSIIERSRQQQTEKISQD